MLSICEVMLGIIMLPLFSVVVARVMTSAVDVVNAHGIHVGIDRHGVFSKPVEGM